MKPFQKNSNEFYKLGSMDVILVFYAHCCKYHSMKLRIITNKIHST